MQPSIFVIRISLVLSLMLTDYIVEAQFADWQAEWIQIADTSGMTEPNQWFCFKKRFELEAVPSSASAAIAVDSKYWLWVNGKMVVFEGGLKRGPNPQDTYYDRLDLAPYLRRGENTVAVLVWFFGKDGFSHKNSGRPGLLFQANLSDRMLSSGEDWRGIRHPAFGHSEAPHPNYRLPESNIYFDARKEIDGWFTPAFLENDWPFCRSVGRPPAAPWNRLAPRPVPQWKDSGLQAYPQRPELPLTSRGDTLVLDLPYNAQVTPAFRIRSSRPGLRIDIRTDNYQGGSAPNVRTVYLTRAGDQTFETPGWMNGHRVRYHFPEGITILDLRYRETGYDTEFAGAFECDDPFFNELWKKARRTLYITMRDTYMDCPDRERAQWWGDVVLESGEAFYALDRQSDLLTRKGILELMNWQRPDSTIYSPVPAGNWDKELPMQMLASVGYYGFWNYFFHSADTATIREVYPRVKKYLEVWQTGEEGLVIPRSGGWTWGDWGDNKDVQLLYNGWYYLAQKGLREMAYLLDRPAGAREAESKMKKLAQAFNQQFWNGSAYRHPAYEGATDDRAQALAVVSGIAPEEYYPAIRKVFQKEYHASPYMEKYVLEALFQMGYPDDALTRMKERFRPMVESDLTTLWEGWGIGSEGYGGGTYNHAWSGGSLTLLSQYVAGVEPLEAGYKKVRIHPRPGPLHQVSAEVQTAAGKIKLGIRKSEDMQLKVAVPEGIEARIYFEDRYANFYHNGQPLKRRDSVQSGEIRISVGPGEHHFRAF